MATNFPVSLDVLSNPTSNSNMNGAGVEHHLQHANANDAIEAIQAKIGTNSSVITSTIEYKLTNKADISFGPAPISANSTGTPGGIVVSGGFIHICVATDTWVKAAVAAW